MPTQFNRLYRFQIKTLEGYPILDTEKLRVVFEITKNLASNPNQAKFSIYNISENTKKILASGEELDISFAVGYPGNTDIIFIGAIRTVNPPIRETVENRVEIVTGDGDRGIRFGTLQETFEGGTQLEFVLQRIVDVMPRVDVGITNGVLGKTAASRGVSLSGDCKTILDSLARQYNFTWSVQDSILETVAVDPTSKEALIEDLGPNAFVVSKNTGMIDTPKLHEKGKLLVRSLINPRIKPGRAINIESSIVNGYFKVLTTKFIGDTDGVPWYMDIEALKIENR